MADYATSPTVGAREQSSLVLPESKTCVVATPGHAPAIHCEGRKGAAELQNIQEGRQAATLFEIPSDYEKLDLAAAEPPTIRKGSPRPGSPQKL
jgi:hypothetical protein